MSSNTAGYDYMSGLQMNDKGDFVNPEDGDFSFKNQANPYKVHNWDPDMLEVDETEHQTVECIFPKWALPIMFIVETLPIDGKSPKTVFQNWIHQERVTIALPENCDFPLTCKAYRRPVRLGPSTRRDGTKVTLKDPSTWPRYARWSGVEHDLVFYNGKPTPLCTHHPKCPPTLDFPGGIMEDGDTPWVQPYDMETMREAEYVKRMQDRAVKEAEEKMERAETEQAAAEKRQTLREKFGKPTDVAKGDALAEKVKAATAAAKAKMTSDSTDKASAPVEKKGATGKE